MPPPQGLPPCLQPPVVTATRLLRTRWTDWLIDKQTEATDRVYLSDKLKPSHCTEKFTFILLVSTYEFQLTGFCFLVSTHWILVSGFYSLVSTHWILLTGFNSLVSSHWILLTGFYLLDSTYWILLTGFYSLVSTGWSNQQFCEDVVKLEV